MLKLLGESFTLKIYESIVGFFKNVGQVVTYEYLLYGGIALILLAVIATIIRTAYTYEVRLLRSVTSMNKYFSMNPNITEDNLIEVNNKFKRVPKTLRYTWQQYMLNRDQVPSQYMNTVICVDQPIRASAHNNAAKILNILTYVIAMIAFMVGFSIIYWAASIGDMGIITGFFQITLVPVIILIVGLLFVAFLRARYTAIIADLYQEFHQFESYINKACITMPSFIDYEILFTRKEIKDGIPALQEYLEKRAYIEQKEREEAELQSTGFESYNFDELGVENSLLVERALLESEKYFNVKRTLTDRITAKENEMFNYQKNFDEVTKEFERKAQAIRENLKQLNEQLNNTSVNIEANYIKKRYKEDQQKLQQLEKDYELASIRFNKQQSDMQAEVEIFNKEILTKKEALERAMSEEGKTYANKIFGLINTKITEQNKPILEQQANEVEALKEQIEGLNVVVREKEVTIADIDTRCKAMERDIEIKKAEIAAIKNVKEYLNSSEFRQRVIERKKGKGSEVVEADMVEVNELRTRTQQAEEQLRIADERKKQLELQENELIVKLRVFEENEKRLKAENMKLQNEINTNEEDKITQVQKDLEALNKKIFEENKNKNDRQEKLMEKINKTLAAPAKPKPASTTKKSSSQLNDLLAKASKLPKKTTKK